MGIYIVAEAGTTHNGDFNTAMHLIHEVKESGADAIKFQMINPDEFMSDKTVMYGEENMYDMFKKLRFNECEWQALTQECNILGIEWFTSIDNIPDIELAESLNCPAYKLSSWDIRNYPLIRALAKTRKHIHVDTGPAIDGEIYQIIDTIKEFSGNAITLVHESHSEFEINLQSIPYLRDTMRHIFGSKINVGYSSNNRDIDPDIMAVTLGAQYIEKRITLDVMGGGHHDKVSLDPQEFKGWVKVIRKCERMLGKYGLYPSIEDIAGKQKWFTSLVANQDIKCGEIITEEMLVAKRPGNGLSPYYSYLFIGKPALTDIKKDEVITYDSI